MRRSVSFEPGARVLAGGLQYRIRRALDLETVLAEDEQTGQTRTVRVAELTPLLAKVETSPVTGPDLAGIPPEAWSVAVARHEVIEPLLDPRRRTRQAIRAAARAARADASTIYRWIQRYEASGRVASLVPGRRGPRLGLLRLPADVEDVIKATIEEKYLTPQRRRPQQVCDEILRRCRAAKLPVPHANTVRRRIAAVTEAVSLRRRCGAVVANQKLQPLRGEFPGADWPLAVVQIDHTELDLVLVDDVRRRPVGRPWITLSIDVFSRMVAGFYVSFDPPGALSTGLCLAHGILPKDKWLASLGISSSWPVWGLMSTVHADNAKEFRGSMLKKACQNYGVDLRWRPVARPHYGGHIERLLGTFSQEIHTLPGTTFSNPTEKGRYDSAAKAAMTLREFEVWLATYVVEVYHQRLHDGIGTTPLQRYHDGIFGTDGEPGRGLPTRILDEERLRLDFMPYVERSVLRYGIVLDDVHYYHDVLRPWINAKDPEDPRRKRRFIVRRDPRDISVVYLFDPDLQQYFQIPYRDTSRPPLSVWELREARRKLKEEGKRAVDEDVIFEAYARMRALEEAAGRRTRAARRTEERRRLHQGVHGLPPARKAAPPPEMPEHVEPFAEMDEEE